MDEVYGDPPLHLTAGLRRAYLSNDDYTSLGAETTRIELEKYVLSSIRDCALVVMVL